MTVTAKQRKAFETLTPGERLRWLMKVRQIKQVDLALKIGITQSGVSNIVSNIARKPSAPTLMRIAEELQCNPTWILTGQGDPYAWAPVTSDTQVELLNLYKSMDADGRKALLAVARSMRAPTPQSV